MQLIRAWGALALLAALGTALHFSALPDPLAGLLILGTAWIKARIILLDYLELRDVPGWSAGLQTGLAGLVLLLMVLFAVS